MAKKWNARNQQPRPSTTKRKPYIQPTFKNYVATSNRCILQPLSEKDERNTGPVAYELFIALTEYLTPAVVRYLRKKGIETHSGPDYDCSQLLYKLIDEVERDKNFLYTEVSVVQLKRAIQGRNNICHINLPAIFRTWESTIFQWIRICEGFRDTHAATNIRAVYHCFKKKSNINKQWEIGCYVYRCATMTRVMPLA